MSPKGYAEIRNPPKRFIIGLDDGRFFKIDLEATNPSKDFPLQIERFPGRLLIHGIDLNVSPDQLKEKWPKGDIDRRVSVLAKGQREYSASYDRPFRWITDTYVVEGNTVVDHYMVVHDEFFSTLFLIAAAGLLYYTGKTVIGVSSFVRRRLRARSRDKGTI